MPKYYYISLTHLCAGPQSSPHSWRHLGVFLLAMKPNWIRNSTIMGS